MKFDVICNPICAQNYDDKQFSTLAEGRSPFHLSVLEAILAADQLSWKRCQAKNRKVAKPYFDSR